jgi:hypothetical protein
MTLCFKQPLGEGEKTLQLERLSVEILVGQPKTSPWTTLWSPVFS